MKTTMNAVIASDHATRWEERLAASTNEPEASLVGAAMSCRLVHHRGLAANLIFS